MRNSYGQFCPLAKACEIVTERWTPIILRELLAGSQRFNDIHRGVPLMSRSLLSKRLKELEREGVVVRSQSLPGQPEYGLTEAGKELGPIVMQLGHWGKQWTKSHLSERDLDAGLLMWDMHRRIHLQKLPKTTTVVHFLYYDAPLGRNAWWLVMRPTGVELCLVDPGLPPDLHVTASLEVMTGIWIGDRSYAAMLQSGDLKVTGPDHLKMRLPGWLMLSPFSVMERQVG